MNSIFRKIQYKFHETIEDYQILKIVVKRAFVLFEGETILGNAKIGENGILERKKIGQI